MTELAYSLERPAPGVAVAQPRRGYRYACEPFWIAGAAALRRPSSALDLGTGSGIIALLLGALGVRAVGVDALPSWAPLWAVSLAASDGLGGRVVLRRADVARLEEDEALGLFDVVVSNPPFFRAADGPASGDPWRRAARTESTASVGAFVRQGAARVAPGGALLLAVPNDRAGDVARALPARLGAVEQIAVGGARTLWVASDGEPGQRARAVPDDGEQVRAWYAAVGARFRGEGQG